MSIETNWTVSIQLCDTVVTFAPCIVQVDFADASILLELYTNASNHLLDGAILTCMDGSLHLVANYSKKYSPIECNYTTSDGELLAVVECLSYF